jgi:hypothetical protein
MSDVRNRPTDRRAAHSATGRRKSPLGWLPWAALLLLLLLAVAAFLIIRNVTDSGDEPGVDVNDDPSGAVDNNGSDDAAIEVTTNLDTPSTVAADAAATADGASTTTASNAPAAATADDGGSTTTASNAGGAAATPANGATAGTLTVGSQSVLPVPASGLAALVGQPATGTGVTVESVVADEGFWVGSSPTDRVFVFLTAEARTTQGESPFQVQAGQRIDLEGTLIALPTAPADLGVEPPEGADQLAGQGHLIEATNVSLT